MRYRYLVAVITILFSTAIIYQPEIRAKIYDANTSQSALTADSKDSRNVVALAEKNDGKINLAQLTSLDSGLPISDIKTYKSDEASGRTAILIPQTHRYPGTEIMDKKNDSAELAQKQIYEVLKVLNDRYAIGLIMTEGDLFGPVPQDKIDTLARKIALRDKFAEQLELFKRYNQENPLPDADRTDFLNEATKVLAALDREIYLAGAPYVLKAEGKAVDLIGAENEGTYEECADLIRDYTYQKDQLASCNASSPAGNISSGLAPLSGSNSDQLKNLLEALRKKGLSASQSISPSILEMLSRQFAPSESFEKLADDVLESLPVSSDNGAKTVLINLKNIHKEINAVDNAPSAAKTENAPSRSENPYAGITDAAKMESLISQSEKSIQDLVIDRRNDETAENFNQALSQHETTTGIIQFGAGHEEGMIKELNDRGIDVVVIKPEEVARRDADDSKLSIVKKLIQDN